jgi:hypothetical protein
MARFGLQQMKKSSRFTVENQDMKITKRKRCTVDEDIEH